MIAAVGNSLGSAPIIAKIGQVSSFKDLPVYFLGTLADVNKNLTYVDQYVLTWQESSNTFILAPAAGSANSQLFTFNSQPGSSLLLNGELSVVVEQDSVIFISANSASIAQSGIVQLNDTLFSNSINFASTANSVNTLNNIIQQNFGTLIIAFNQANNANILAQSGFNQANAANNLATSSYQQANASNNLATFSYEMANSSNILAQASFNQANSSNNLATSGYQKANNANIFAQGAFVQANTANILAQAAFNEANISFTFANNVNTYAYSAYSQANSSNNLATSAYQEANSANILAQAAFTQANNSNNIVLIQTIYTETNASFIQANAANNLAQGAYNQANADYIFANNVNNFSFSAFSLANSANILAQAAFDQANTVINYLPLSGGSITGQFNSNNGFYVLSNISPAIISKNNFYSNIVPTSALQLIGANNSQIRLTIDAFGGAPQLSFRRADGTSGNLNNVILNDVIFNINGFGYGNTSYSSSPRGSIQYIAAENWTDSNQGTHFLLQTTGIGKTTTLERMRITANGNVLIGYTVDNNIDVLQVNGSINSTSLTTNNISVGPTTIYSNGMYIYNDTNVATPGISGNATIHIFANTSEQAKLLIDTFSTAASIVGRVASGTPIAPTNAITNIGLLNLTGQGYGTTGYSSNRIQLILKAAENWTDANQGTFFQFTGTQIGSNTISEWMRLYNSHLLIGTTVDDGINALQVNGGINASSLIINNINVSQALINASNQANNTNANINILDSGALLRNTVATYWNSNGTISTANVNQARPNNTISSIGNGFLIENYSQNLIRNPRCEGAVINGTIPTDWGVDPKVGFTTTVANTGIDQSLLQFVDINLSGANNGVANTFYPNFYRIFPDNGAISSTLNEPYSLSTYISLVGGSLANINFITVGLVEIGTNGNQFDQSNNISSNLTSNLQKFSYSTLTSNVNITSIKPAIFINYVEGNTINVTLRVAGTQLELGNNVTSLILPPSGNPGVSTRGPDLYANSIFDYSSFNILTANTFKSTYFSQNTINTNYTLQISDGGSVIVCNNSSNANVYVSNNLGIGFSCTIKSVGTGNVFIYPLSTNLFQTSGTNNMIAKRYASATVYCYAANNYILDGTVI